MRRVVVTGIGIWSCLGKNVDEVRQSLRSGMYIINGKKVVLK